MTGEIDARIADNARLLLTMAAITKKIPDIQHNIPKLFFFSRIHYNIHYRSC